MLGSKKIPKYLNIRLIPLKGHLAFIFGSPYMNKGNNLLMQIYKFYILRI